MTYKINVYTAYTYKRKTNYRRASESTRHVNMWYAMNILSSDIMTSYLSMPPAIHNNNIYCNILQLKIHAKYRQFPSPCLVKSAPNRWCICHPSKMGWLALHVGRLWCPAPVGSDSSRLRFDCECVHSAQRGVGERRRATSKQKWQVSSPAGPSGCNKAPWQQKVQFLSQQVWIDPCGMPICSGKT